MHGRGRLLALASILLPLGLGTACDSCGNVNCGAGLMVWWQPNDVPHGSYELCVEDRCETAGAHGRQGVVLVEPGIGASRGDPVTLRVTTPDGSTMEYHGSGKLRGDCCKAVILKAETPGELLDRQFE